MFLFIYYNKNIQIRKIMTISESEIKKLFLENELFSQFKNNQTKLKIEILEPGSFRLHLTTFPGLNIEKLSNHAFNTLQVKGINIINGFINSGGPDGVVVQYQYKIPENEILLVKIKQTNKPK